MQKLPPFLKKYFWEVDFKGIDPQKHRKYIAERVLEYGDEKDIRWLFDNFSKRELRNIIANTRVLSKKSLNFWLMYFDIPKERVRCLKPSYQKMRGALWPF